MSIIQDVSAVLLMQNVAVPRSNIQAREDGPAARKPQTLVVCERGAVQTERMIAPDVHRPVFVAVSNES